MGWVGVCVPDLGLCVLAMALGRPEEAPVGPHFWTRYWTDALPGALDPVRLLALLVGRLATPGGYCDWRALNLFRDETVLDPTAVPR